MTGLLGSTLAHFKRDASWQLGSVLPPLKHVEEIGLLHFTACRFLHRLTCDPPTEILTPTWEVSPKNWLAFLERERQREQHWALWEIYVLPPSQKVPGLYNIRYMAAQQHYRSQVRRIGREPDPSVKYKIKRRSIQHRNRGVRPSAFDSDICTLRTHWSIHFPLPLDQIMAVRCCQKWQF